MTDTLCHSYRDVYYDPTYGGALHWTPMGESWGGESGSGGLLCPDDSCHTGKIDVVATRWMTQGFSSIDSVMSGIISAILKDVKVPTASVLPVESARFAMHLEGGSLRANSDREGEWKVLSLDGRAIGASSFGKSFSISQDQLPRGVALVVFRAPGQAPITQRWAGQR